MFDAFALDHLDLETGVRARVRHGGPADGPPVLLLHGHPRTHATWHRVAPRLADAGLRVVCPDLRGYGGSSLPPDEPRHAQSSKRAMAADAVALMAALGHERFAVAGHDRGAPAAFRTAMDHPDRVTRLVVMEGLPLIEHLERTDARFAQAWWHWWFLGQTDKPAEVAIDANPEWWYRVSGPEAMGREAHADLWAALRNPAVVHGMCEDYRAGLTVDPEHDAADRAAGRAVACPTLVLWAQEDDLDLHGDPLEIWRPWAPDLRGGPLPGGHHLAEDSPEELSAALVGFLT